MRVHIHTLGCKANVVDSERIARGLADRGHEVVDVDFEILLVNTCTVTDSADKKSQQAARRGGEDIPVLITGCSARTAAEKWKEKFPNAVIVPTPDDVLSWFDAQVDREAPIHFTPNRTRRFIEIQKGCDTYCSYCIIPQARGKSSSVPLEEIIAEIHEAEREGIQEVVLTGINLAAWGCTHTRKPEEAKFGELLLEILDQTTIPRIRISSVGPEFVYNDDDFYTAFANPRICDHLHISVQSGCDATLERMARGHGVTEITELIRRARELRPDFAATCDVIVGFPGETEEEFETTIQQLREWKMARLHVFPFSVRSGTVAEKLPHQIPTQTKKERSKILRDIGVELAEQFETSQLGKEKSVLWELDGTGHTTNFLRVKGSGTPGDISQVILDTEILF